MDASIEIDRDAIQYRKCGETSTFSKCLFTYMYEFADEHCLDCNVACRRDLTLHPEILYLLIVIDTAHATPTAAVTYVGQTA